MVRNLERKRVVMFKFHSERQARVHTVESFFSLIVFLTFGDYTHWTRKYFMYCFKFYIFVLSLILFHFST